MERTSEPQGVDQAKALRFRARFAWLAGVGLGLGLAGCSLPAPPAAPAATPAAVALSPTPGELPAATEAPWLLQFVGHALERVGDQGRTLWLRRLPEESDRSLAVVGETVMVWGSSGALRRYRVADGAPQGQPLAVGRLGPVVVAGGALVGCFQDALQSGLVGVTEGGSSWRRPGWLASSLVIAGPPGEPVVLMVEKTTGEPLALRPGDGREAGFPLPEGVFDSVRKEADSGMIGWYPRGGGPPSWVDGESGRPL